MNKLSNNYARGYVYREDPNSDREFRLRQELTGADKLGKEGKIFLKYSGHLSINNYINKENIIFDGPTFYRDLDNNICSINKTGFVEDGGCIEKINLFLLFSISLFFIASLIIFEIFPSKMILMCYLKKKK